MNYSLTLLLSAHSILCTSGKPLHTYHAPKRPSKHSLPHTNQHDDAKFIVNFQTKSKATAGLHISDQLKKRRKKKENHLKKNKASLCTAVTQMLISRVLPNSRKIH